LVSRRYRDNNSVSSRVSKLASDVGLTQRQGGIKSDTIVPENFTTDSVDREAIAPNAVGSEQLQRGAVGTEELGVVNEINSDSILTLKAPNGIRMDAPGISRSEATGTVVGGPSAASEWGTGVTFPAGRFNVPPLVFVNLNHANSASLGWSARGVQVTTTGFYVYGSGSAAASFSAPWEWYAIQMTTSSSSG
jgi:hypothetical protein